jgi:hypothetical protein
MDEKKKIVVVGALVVVVLGIGAFQMTSGGLSGPQEKVKTPGEQAVAAKDGDAKKAETEEFVLRNPLFANTLPARDPFEEGSITNSLKPPEPNRYVRPPVRNTSANPGTQPFRPLGAGDRLPEAFAGGNNSLQPGVPLRDPDAFALTVTGVIMGARPAAIFQDDAGNQRLVALGGELDGGSRVTGISRGKVTVSHKGKTVTLTVGANTDGN